MTDDEKATWLAEYDAWMAPPPEGWLSMADLDLRRGGIEYLLEDGRRVRTACVSNTERRVEGWRPVAWRPLDEPANKTVGLSRLKAGIQ